ncbi:lipid phosphate phosphatase 2-like [Melia azedarach]|uniref:Lipid phosphate phosphatase 2-like n=1 Tax=Melia azedarach TaxID=155640 RepID=A0ACC1XEM8_MELAZ|nr:lipid phosphate phosphatase 2-like [Melia azedarach]
MAWGSFCCFNSLRRFFQRGEMREIDLGAHTIQSHGARVARHHLHDWIILVLLGVIVIVLNVIDPFYRYVGKDMMTDLKYPFKDNTVPTWSVPIYAVLLPILIFLLFYVRRRDVYDLHHGILGLLYAVLITGVITDAIKDATGRPRPDFFWRCFPDGVENFNGPWGDVICHGKNSEVKEGHKSFPSGHASWSFAGLGFLSLYLSGKIKAFDHRGHVAKLCIVLLPLLAASLVAVSRVSDYWHHWQDVFAGGIIGLAVAVFCYLQFFPPPHSDDGWSPYAYFRAREESNTNMNMAHSMSSVQVQAMNNHRPVDQQSRGNGDGFTSLYVDSSPSSTVDQMELGRR